jgi:hypothetical protein
MPSPHPFGDAFGDIFYALDGAHGGAAVFMYVKAHDDELKKECHYSDSASASKSASYFNNR